MNKDFSVKLSVEIEDPKTIEKKFDEKLKTVKPTVKANVDVDANGAAKATTAFDSLESALSAAGLQGKQLTDILTGQRKEFMLVKQTTNNAGQTVSQYINKAGKLVEVTQRVNEGQTKYYVTTTNLNKCRPIRIYQA